MLGKEDHEIYDTKAIIVVFIVPANLPTLTCPYLPLFHLFTTP